MKSTITIACLFVAIQFAFSQPDLNVSLVGQVEYSSGLNDVWGYAAPDGTEYALVGLTNGVSIVSLADPENPDEVHFIPGIFSGWRDIKTWDNYAYVTNETANGLAVIDLNHLPDSISAYNWTPNIPGLGTLSSCHNIFIDEYGYAYLSGCNINGGGVLYIDVFREPGTPSYVGKGPAIYSHDAYARDSIMYSADIGAGYFSVHDVRDKTASQLLATQFTPSFFTHNVWLSDDGLTIFTTDETGDAPVGAYDISDLDNIVELDQFRPFFSLNQGAVPHNVFVWDDYLIISYYTEGCIVVDAHRPSNLVQVGNFDTFLQASGGFGGAWGAYPFLPSGLILISDQSNGLFILEPNYVRASYLEGLITNAIDGSNLFEAKVDVLDELPFTYSNLEGKYATGIATPGEYPIRISKPGFIPVDTTVTLASGEVTELNVALVPLNTFSITGVVTDMETGSSIPAAKILLQGAETSFESTADENGAFSLSIFEGDYSITAGKWGYKTAIAGTQSLNETNNTISLELEPGLEDIFLLDLGWTETGSTVQGAFELAVPPLSVTTDNGGTTVTIQPGEDSPEDEGNGCYITDNSTDLFGGVLLLGTTTLESPTFDLSNMEDPWIAYETWMLNALTNGGASGNDELVVRLENDSQLAIVEVISDASLFDGTEWTHSEFRVRDYMEPSDNMRLKFLIVDTDQNDITEAAVDYFRVFDNPGTASQDLAPDAFFLHAFPNPSTKAFQLQYDVHKWDGNAQVAVYNILGKVIEVFPIDQKTGTITLGEHYTPGVYTVQIQNASQASKAIKLFKQ